MDKIVKYYKYNNNYIKNHKKTIYSLTIGKVYEVYESDNNYNDDRSHKFNYYLLEDNNTIFRFDKESLASSWFDDVTIHETRRIKLEKINKMVKTKNYEV